MSMQTTTPSESSDTSTSRWVRSNMPRAYITYSADPTTSANMSSNRMTALSSRFFTGGGWSRGGGVGVGFMACQ
ncbi:hypothetical protein D9M69_647430 [compost metagenome]